MNRQIFLDAFYNANHRVLRHTQVLCALWHNKRRQKILNIDLTHRYCKRHMIVGWSGDDLRCCWCFTTVLVLWYATRAACFCGGCKISWSASGWSWSASNWWLEVAFWSTFSFACCFLWPLSPFLSLTDLLSLCFFFFTDSFAEAASSLALVLPRLGWLHPSSFFLFPSARPFFWSISLCLLPGGVSRSCLVDALFSFCVWHSASL